MVRWRASVLSLGSGDGIPVPVGQNEVCQKWQNLDNTIQYNTMAAPMKWQNPVNVNTIFINNASEMRCKWLQKPSK